MWDVTLEVLSLLQGTVHISHGSWSTVCIVLHHFIYSLPSLSTGGWFLVTPQIPNTMDAQVCYGSKVAGESKVMLGFSTARAVSTARLPTPVLCKGHRSCFYVLILHQERDDLR